MRALTRSIPYAVALIGTAVTLAIAGAIESIVGDPRSAVLLSIVPVVLSATRSGRGPAIVAAIASVAGHNLLFIDPRGSLTIARPEDALSLVLLLFTALITGQLADSARRGARRAQDAEVARRSDELKTVLLRAVGHDLRTPLASIKASVSGLRQADGQYSAEDRAELLATVEEEADRLDRLVGNLLDLSRIEAGALRPAKEAEDIAELINGTVSRLSQTLGERSVTVTVPEGCPPVPCDYVQIAQALKNLLENAALHTPDGTPIAVRVIAGSVNVRIEVADSGPGVAPESRERIFHAFERGPSSRGTGLGLAIARGLVEAHGGRLWLTEATGACFAFTLPLSTTPQ
ncbi:MAG: PAS domain-containing sensor histidine kinase [Chloroflexota bacterium]|nr:MAG: PAS domain-containing sensor histidine kinase [Chloroflexota bacterium]